MLLQRPDAVVAHHADDVHAVARERVELHPAEAERAVAEQQHDLALGVRELGRQRVAGPGAQAAERPRVQPAARLVGVDDAPRVGDEVAAVADDDRVAVEHLAELARRGASGAAARGRRRARPARPRASRSRPRAAARPTRRSRIRPPAAVRSASSVAADRAVAARPRRRAGGRGPARRGRSTTISVSSPNDAPKPRRKSIGTPTTSATSAPFSAVAARAREEQLVVGGHAAAREAVEEDRDAAAPRRARAARPRRGPSRGSCRP